MIIPNRKITNCRLLCLSLFLIIMTASVSGFFQAQWQIIDFTEHGTRRIVEIDDNRWYFYRSEPNRELTLDITGGRIMIKSAVREDIDNLAYQVRINNAFRNFSVDPVEESGDFLIMEDIFLNLSPGIHELRISTSNRLAYFKVFRDEDVWTVPTERGTFEPDQYIAEQTLVSEDTESPYYLASSDHPLEFRTTGPNKVDGFSRFLINETELEGEFDIEVNGKIVERVTIPLRQTGSYWLMENEELPLSIGRRLEFTLPSGEHLVRIIPRSGHNFIFRLFMEIPVEIPESDEPVYDETSFREESMIERALTGLELTIGASFGYNDNIFSLSDYDMDRFEAGNPIFDFVETADDLIINPSMRARYPIFSGDFTFTPYINANYYQYLNNTDKSNYSILSGLFNRYKDFNLNLYYGYYGDLYARDYIDREGTDEYEKFEYEKNLYRIYSYFSLTRYDTPLLYFQIEDYFYNQFFTEYDGRATTYGIGWRRSFPSFYLRLFYYYREFLPENVHYVLDEVAIDDRITDPEYESNIYDIQFRNKRSNLFGDYDFRPYFGLRIENRYYKTMLPVQVAPFQSSREENRYRITLGCEFYLVKNLNIILDFKHYIRNTSSEYENLPRYKDYRQNVFSLDFEYTFNF